MTIAAYLEELERELRLRRAPRVRLLEEVDHHLRDLAGELAGGGLSQAQAEERAIARFGDATTVAAGFAEAAASTTTRRAVRAAVASFAGYAVVFVAFGTAASPLLRDFPQGAASFFAIQVAAVALAVAAVRSLRWRGVAAAPSGELAEIARCLFVVCVVLLAAGVCEAGVALSRPAGVIAWSEGRWLTLGLAVAVLLLLVSGLSAARAAAQASAVAALPMRRERTRAESLVDNVDVLLRGTRLPAVRRIALTALARPWQTMSLTAATAFLAVTAAGFREGLAGAVALGAFETTAIMVSFLALGGLLGLREGATRSRRAC
jgi:hypothetical protein